MKKYFVYDPEGGVYNAYETYETQEEALEEAKKMIEGYLDEGGWCEGVSNIIVGTITHQSKATDVRKKVGEVDEDGYDESGQEWTSEFDETCNYEMLPLEAQNK